MVAELAPTPAFTLRPYQRESIAAVLDAYNAGISRPLLSLPTGGGKTVVFMYIVAVRGGRALIIAHRDELIEQAAAKAKMILPSASVGIVKAQRNQIDADVVVASVQTLTQRHRLAQFDRTTFPTIVIDEAHHATARTYTRVLDHFDAVGNQYHRPLVLGVTATPERTDSDQLGWVWEKIVYQVQIADLVRQGYLCPIAGKQVKLDIDFASLHQIAGDYDNGELVKAMDRANAATVAAQAYVDHAATRKGLVFAVNIPHSREIAERLNAAGIRAEHLDGTMPADMRHGILGRLRSGATQVVTNCAVLTEGFDEPSIECVMMARPTASKPLYMQCVGRGTRKSDETGKADLLIIDLVGASTTHNLVTATDLFKDLKVGVGARPGPGGAPEAPEDAEGVTSTEDVDVFRGQVLRWVRLPAGMGVLSLGRDQILTIPAPDGSWSVWRNPQGGPPLAIATRLDQGYAFGVATDYAHTHGIGSFMRHDEAWRDLPPTEGQIESAPKWGLPPPPPGMTRGQFSDEIEKAKAQRFLRKLRREGRMA